MPEKEENCLDHNAEKIAQYDFHGIYCGKMCDECFNAKYKQYDYIEEENNFYEG